MKAGEGRKGKKGRIDTEGQRSRRLIFLPLDGGGRHCDFERVDQ
jgi:hypothetical protein